ncbi:hypothetical protein RDI58_009974 [Solanum bulbocastanum]|uniref:Uncharacterized protein n=1 Tax=Solanum bulbocastanum TaxID=147425 RepID=A0AAN8TLY8_SOLBU
MDTHGGEGIDPAVVPAGEAAGALLDFATQTGNADVADCQEEVYQQIKSMKEKYLSDIHDEYQNIASKVQQMHPVQANLGSLWQNSSILQQSLLKLHEQQMLQDQQLRQMYQQQQAFHSQQLMQHQQLFHRHQLMQQLLRQLQQQTVQLPAHKMSQLHQLTDVNDLMMRQQMGMKTGVLQQRQSVSQCVGFHHPQVKSEISSPQAYQAVSPQGQNLLAVDESNKCCKCSLEFSMKLVPINEVPEALMRFHKS